jgi:hypothetical protein
MSLIKKLRIFFLLLAGFMFNVHMIIPHDHHIMESGSCQIPISQSHHPIFPAHCHAFNGLTSEKAISYNKIEPYRVLELLPGSMPEIMSPDIESYKPEVFNTFLSGNTDIPDYSLLRAPPSLI